VPVSVIPPSQNVVMGYHQPPVMPVLPTPNHHHHHQFMHHQHVSNGSAPPPTAGMSSSQLVSSGAPSCVSPPPYSPSTKALLHHSGHHVLSHNHHAAAMMSARNTSMDYYPTYHQDQRQPLMQPPAGTSSLAVIDSGTAYGGSATHTSQQSVGSYLDALNSDCLDKSFDSMENQRLDVNVDDVFKQVFGASDIPPHHFDLINEDMPLFSNLAEEFLNMM